MAKKKKNKKKKKTAKKKPLDPLGQIPKITPYPTAGPKITEFEDRLDAQIAGDEPKRGPGRPRKQQPSEQVEPEGLDVGIVARLVKMPFELWAINQKIEELVLEDKEAAQIAEPVKQLLDHYLPQIPAIAYAWIALTVNGFWIMRTRLLLIKAIQEYNKNFSSEAQPAGIKDEGHGGPRPPASPAGQGGKFPTETETVKA